MDSVRNSNSKWKSPDATIQISIPIDVSHEISGISASHDIFQPLDEEYIGLNGTTNLSAIFTEQRAHVPSPEDDPSPQNALSGSFKDEEGQNREPDIHSNSKKGEKYDKSSNQSEISEKSDKFSLSDKSFEKEISEKSEKSFENDSEPNKINNSDITKIGELNNSLRKSSFNPIDFGSSVPESPVPEHQPVESTVIPFEFANTNDEEIFDDMNLVIVSREAELEKSNVIPKPPYQKDRSIKDDNETIGELMTVLNDNHTPSAFHALSPQTDVDNNSETNSDKRQFEHQEYQRQQQQQQNPIQLFGGTMPPSKNSPQNEQQPQVHFNIEQRDIPKNAQKSISNDSPISQILYPPPHPPAVASSKSTTTATSAATGKNNTTDPIRITSPRRSDEDPYSATGEQKSVRLSSTFTPIDFESSDIASEEESVVTEEKIDSLLQTLPDSDKHIISPDSNFMTPLHEVDNDDTLFGATAPPKPNLMIKEREVHKSDLCITPMDLQKIMENETPPNEDKETTKALKRFKKTGRLPATSNAPKIIQKLQRERVNAIIQGDYDQAKEVDDLSRNVALSITISAEEEKRNDRIHRAEFKLSEEKKIYDDFHREWLHRLHSEEYSLKQRLLYLQEVHNQEIRAFEEKWNNEDFLRRFSKPSISLLQLKAIERSMVITKMFDQAKSIRTSSQVLEKKETNEAQLRARREMTIEKKRMISRQNREFGDLQLKCDQQMEIFMLQMKKEESPYLARINKLEKLISDLRNGIENHARIVPATVQTTERGAGNELLTSRTVFKYSAFKATAQSMKLKIQPLGNCSKGARKKRVIRIQNSK